MQCAAWAGGLAPVAVAASKAARLVGFHFERGDKLAKEEERPSTGQYQGIIAAYEPYPGLPGPVSFTQWGGIDARARLAACGLGYECGTSAG